MVLGRRGGRGLVLRYGFFYGPGTYYGDDGTTTADVRRRRMPIVGRGSGRVLVHPRRRRRRRDGRRGRARRRPASTTSSTTSPRRCASGCPCSPRRAGAKRPRRVPVWLARFVGGREVADLRARASRRLQREGEARARLAAGPPELARPASRSRCAAASARPRRRSAGRPSPRSTTGRRRPRACATS